MALYRSLGGILAAVIVSFCLASAVSATPVFTEIPVEELDFGLLYCNSSISADGRDVAILWSGKVYHWSELGGLRQIAEGDQTDPTSGAMGISGDGRVIGAAVMDGKGIFQPALWSEDGGWRYLGGVPGDEPLGNQFGSANALSHDGSVVTGLVWAENSVGAHRAAAYRWTEATGLVALPKEDDYNARAYQLSGDGEIVVGFHEGTSGIWEAARWIGDEGPDFFLGKGTAGNALAISASGEHYVVVIEGDSYYYTDAGGPVALGLSGWPYQRGADVSNDGTVVGWTNTAVLWTEEDGLRNLASYLTGLGCTGHQGWNLVWAISISEDGSSIIGAGIKPNGWAGFWHVRLDGFSEAPVMLTGPGPGSANPPLVRAWDPQQLSTPLSEFSAYGVPAYGVNVATGNLDGQVGAEIITGPGPGEMFGPHVRAFDLDGTPLAGGAVSFMAYGTHKYGVNVSAGDIDGDGFDEIVTGPGPGAVFGPHVRGFDYDGDTLEPIQAVSFFAYGTNKFGANVTTGDVDGDGIDEIITGAGPGAVFGPHVRGFDHDGGSGTTPVPGLSFFAYGTHKWGVNVACGDVDGDGIDEIITGPGPGTVFGPHVRGWDHAGGQTGPLPGLSFLAYGTSQYGANVTCGDFDGDGRDEIFTVPGPGPGFGSQVKGWRYDGSSVAHVDSIDFFAYDPATVRFGGRLGFGGFVR